MGEPICRRCGAPESTEWHRAYYVQVGINNGAHPFVPRDTLCKCRQPVETCFYPSCDIDDLVGA